MLPFSSFSAIASMSAASEPVRSSAARSTSEKSTSLSAHSVKLSLPAFHLRSFAGKRDR
jgi:hypothetical protein